MNRLLAALLGTSLLVLNVPAAHAAPSCFGRTATITGGSGDDVINGTAGPDVISAGAGFDSISGGDGNDLICGGADGDVIYGDRGNDKLAGQGGVDQLQGGSGSDLMKGGGQVDANFAGGDIVSYADASAPVTVNLVTGKGGPEGQDQDTISGMFSITGSDFGDTLTASAGDHGNRIAGRGGDDTIFGNDGRSPGDFLSGDEGTDSVFARGGPDTVTGGPGDDGLYGGGDPGDTLSYHDATAAVQVDLGNGSATGEGLDSLSGFSNLIGSPFGDSLTGDDTANSIEGNTGSDSIFGKGGPDSLDAKDGVSGNDTANGGPGVDTCSYDAGDIVISCP